MFRGNNAMLFFSGQCYLQQDGRGSWIRLQQSKLDQIKCLGEAAGNPVEQRLHRLNEKTTDLQNYWTTIRYYLHLYNIYIYTVYNTNNNRVAASSLISHQQPVTFLFLGDCTAALYFSYAVLLSCGDTVADTQSCVSFLSSVSGITCAPFISGS